MFRAAPEITLKRRQLLFDSKRSGQSIFMVTSGLVKSTIIIDGREMLHDYHLSGELLGCELVFGELSPGISVTAATNPTKVKRLPIAYLKDTLGSQPEFFEEIGRSLVVSLQRSKERLVRLAMLNAEQRVIHFLVTHTRKAGKQVGFEYVVKPLPTHQELGHIAGTGRQTVTTVLNELRRKGLIHFNRQYLLVRDLDSLTQLCPH